MIQPDPIAAEAMLFFKGWQLLLMSIATHVGGHDRWRRPWKQAGVAGRLVRSGTAVWSAPSLELGGSTSPEVGFLEDSTTALTRPDS